MQIQERAGIRAIPRGPPGRRGDRAEGQVRQPGSLAGRWPGMSLAVRRAGFPPAEQGRHQAARPGQEPGCRSQCPGALSAVGCPFPPPRREGRSVWCGVVWCGLWDAPGGGDSGGGQSLSGTPVQTRYCGRAGAVGPGAAGGQSPGGCTGRAEAERQGQAPQRPQQQWGLGRSGGTKASRMREGTRGHGGAGAALARDGGLGRGGRARGLAGRGPPPPGPPRSPRPPPSRRPASSRPGSRGSRRGGGSSCGCRGSPTAARGP